MRGTLPAGVRHQPSVPAPVPADIRPERSSGLAQRRSCARARLRDRAAARESCGRRPRARRPSSQSAAATRTPTRPAALRGTTFRGSEQVGAGLLTPGQLRSSAWRRLFPDVYACASLPVTHHRRARAVARLLLPGAVLSGRSAAVLWGVDAAERDDPVECTLAPARRCGAVRGVHVTRRHLPDDDVVQRHGVLVTTPMRTALDLASAADLRDPVALVARVAAALDAPRYA